MARFSGVVLSGLVALQISVPAQEPPRQTLRSAVDLVRVDAVVLDRWDNPVHGLRQHDFRIFEDGKAKPIESFTEVSADAGAADGRLIALLLDDVAVNPVLTERVRQVARGFIQRMGPLDEMAVVRLNGDAGRSTRDRAALLEAIDLYRPDTVSPAVRWNEHTLETIAEMAAQFAEAEHPRKTLVCVGASHLFNLREPVHGDTFVRPYWFDAIRAAARYNVSVYVIDPNGLDGLIGTHDAAGFAWETGGQAFRTNMFDHAVDQIWREAGNYYLLGYSATPEQTGDRTRRIKVSTTRADVTVRARRAIG